MSHRDDLDADRLHARYEKLIHHSSDVVFVVDEEGTYQYVSPAIEGVLGYDPEELVGRNGFELVHEADRERTMAEFLRAVENPEHRPTVEFRAEDASGEWRWLEVRGRNLLEDPDVEGFVVNARDVTERKAYERELEAHERRLRQITEHLPDTAIWMTDPGFSEVQYVSPGYEDIWGHPPEALYEDPEQFLDAVHPDDRERVLEGMAGLLDESDDGEPPPETHIEYRVYRSDGSVCWVRSKTVPIEGAEGGVSRWVGITTEVTEEKERERRLEGYRVLAEAVPDGVFMVDEVGTMRFVNETWAAMLGRSASELEGTPFRDLVEAGLVDESVTERYGELLRELLSSGNDRERGTLRIKTSLPGQSQERVYQAHVGLLPYEESFRGSAIVVRDLTALQQVADD